MSQGCYSSSNLNVSLVEMSKYSSLREPLPYNEKFSIT